MLNFVVIMGRLTADPELRTTQSGISVCNIKVACERKNKKSGEEAKTDFIRVRTWRQTADFVSRYFRKGQMIAVTGELHCDPYTDKNGNKRTDDYIEATNVSFCGDRASDYGNAYNPQQNGYNMGFPAQNNQQYAGQPNFSVLPDNNGDESGLPWSGEMEFNPDEDTLPF